MLRYINPDADELLKSVKNTEKIRYYQGSVKVLQLWGGKVDDVKCPYREVYDPYNYKRSDRPNHYRIYMVTESYEDWEKGLMVVLNPSFCYKTSRQVTKIKKQLLFVFDFDDILYDSDKELDKGSNFDIISNPKPLPLLKLFNVVKELGMNYIILTGRSEPCKKQIADILEISDQEDKVFVRPFATEEAEKVEIINSKAKTRAFIGKVKRWKAKLLNKLNRVFYIIFIDDLVHSYYNYAHLDKSIVKIDGLANNEDYLNTINELVEELD